MYSFNIDILNDNINIFKVNSTIKVTKKARIIITEFGS